MNYDVTGHDVISDSFYEILFLFLYLSSLRTNINDNVYCDSCFLASVGFNFSFSVS